MKIVAHFRPVVFRGYEYYTANILDLQTVSSQMMSCILPWN